MTPGLGKLCCWHSLSEWLYYLEVSSVEPASDIR